MFKVYLISAIMILLLAGFTNPSYGDQRSFVWTYEYVTLPRGAVEFEYYNTLSTPDINTFDGVTSTEQQLEFEIGMTDHFDFSMYQVFTQAPGEDLHYKGYKFRARYRFGEKNRYFVDPLLYAEYKGKPDFSEHGIELKVILAKDIGKFTLSVNPILELEQEDDEWEAETEYAAGVSYAVAGEMLRLGIEAKGSEYGHYLGPVVSHGRTHAWAALGSALKISDIDGGKPEMQIRLIMGFNL